MARAETKSVGDRSAGTQGVAEVFVHDDAVSLCLLVNRRARILRVIDFRAGPSAAKRDVVFRVAAREGAEKVFTLVERDEVATWQRLGFAREASLPAFYKRSDAFVLGALAGAPVPEGLGADEADETGPGDVPFESGTRIVAASPSRDAAHDVMDRTIAQGKRLAHAMARAAAPATRWRELSDSDARKLVSAAARRGRALTGFEAFGRDVQRRHWVAQRGGIDVVASVEAQPCFGSAFIELLEAPRSEDEALAVAASLRDLLVLLAAQGTVCAFALGASDDARMSAAFLYAGFRRTGLLRAHRVAASAAGRRGDAIVWSRKLGLADD